MKKHIPLVISLIFCIIASSCTNSEQTGTKASTSLPEITTQHEKNNDINEIIQSQHSDSAVAVESEEILPTKQKIKVNADELIVRETKSKDSKMIGKVPAGTIFEVMDEGRDDEGGLWYKINYEFGVTGWIAGWYCESTDEKVNYCIKSEPGKMLSEFENNDLLVELLLLGEYSLDSLIQRYGKEYTLKKEYGNDVYEYPNGININVTDEGFTSKVGIYDFSFYVNSIKTKTCDIYENEGEEILVIYEYHLHHRLLVLDAGSKEVIEEYDLSYLEVFQLEVGDFFNNGKLELYIDGTTNGLLKREIYRVAEDDFFRLYDISSFDLYREGIKAKIDKNDLRLDIDIGKYSMHEISVLPDRIFSIQVKQKTRMNCYQLIMNGMLKKRMINGSF